MILLYLGISPYSASRHRGMIEAYGRRTLVAYLDPDPVLHPDPEPRRRLLEQVSEGHETGVTTLSLASSIPAARLDSIAAANRWFAVRRLTKSLRSLTDEPLVLVVQKPGLLRTLKALDLDLSIYEVRDNHVGLARLEQSSDRVVRRIARHHRTLVKQSDMVWVTSEVLADDVRQDRIDAINIGHGVDYSLFDSGNADHAPRELLDLPSPRIGVIGNLNDRIDWNLLISLAESRPEWQIIAIGPLYSAGPASVLGLQKLMNRPNGHHIKEIPETQIPAAISALDVCLIPYVLNPVTLRIDALKLYQYLAVGKPIVAASLPSLQDFREVVTICAGPEDFIQGIAQALRGTDSQVTARRKAVARRFDWQSVTDRQLDVIRDRLRADQAPICLESS